MLWTPGLPSVALGAKQRHFISFRLTLRVLSCSSCRHVEQRSGPAAERDRGVAGLHHQPEAPASAPAAQHRAAPPLHRPPVALSHAADQPRSCSGNQPSQLPSRPSAFPKVPSSWDSMPPAAHSEHVDQVLGFAASLAGPNGLSKQLLEVRLQALLQVA